MIFVYNTVHFLVVLTQVQVAFICRNLPYIIKFYIVAKNNIIRVSTRKKLTLTEYQANNTDVHHLADTHMQYSVFGVRCL